MLVVVAATLGIGLLYLSAWILSIFGVDLRFWTDPSPAGIAISVVICIVAALNLFIDFAVVDRGVSGGAPAFMEWYSAWGLLATVVWLYLEVLYLLAGSGVAERGCASRRDVVRMGPEGRAPHTMGLAAAPRSRDGGSAPELTARGARREGPA